MKLVECPGTIVLKNALDGVGMTCIQFDGLQGPQRDRDEMPHPSTKTSESCFSPGDTVVSTARRALIGFRSGPGPFR